VKEDYLSYEEGEAATIGFITSSFIVSSLGKILFLDSICEIAKSTAELKTGPQIMESSQVCLGFLEAWLRAFKPPLTTNWYFWILAIGGAITEVLIYKYS